MPRHKGLDDAASLDDLGLSVLAFGKDISFEELLRFIETEVENDGSRRQRQDSILLKLIAHDGCIGQARRSDGEPLL